eukprot:gene3686-biopygen3585
MHARFSFLRALLAAKFAAKWQHGGKESKRRHGGMAAKRRQSFGLAPVCSCGRATWTPARVFLRSRDLDSGPCVLAVARLGLLPVRSCGRATELATTEHYLEPMSRDRKNTRAGVQVARPQEHTGQSPSRATARTHGLESKSRDRKNTRAGVPVARPQEHTG